MIMADAKKDMLVKMRARMGLAPDTSSMNQTSKAEELSNHLKSQVNNDRMQAIHNPSSQWQTYTAHADHQSLMLTDELLALSMSAMLVGIQDGDFPLKAKRSVLIRAENMLTAMIDMISESDQAIVNPEMLNAVKYAYTTTRMDVESQL